MLLGVLCLLLVPLAAVVSQGFALRMQQAALGERIREEGLRSHRRKGGTPTMGGVVILVLWSVCLPFLGWFKLFSLDGLFIFACGLSFGAVGAIDDFLSLRYRRSLGLSPWQKVALVTVASAILFFAFPHIARTPLQVPFASVTLSLPSIAFFFLAWVVFLTTTNSMNLTDGLDGLATGVSILVLCGFLIITPTREFAGVILPLIAILVGFLWVNAYPARLFLGDVGAFALGGVVAGVALASGTALILPLLAGLLVLESGSVILQVSCYRLTGRRLFKMSPLHHHFEHAEGIDHPYFLPAVEWPEPKITLRLWIVQALFVGLAVLACRF